MDWQIRLIGTYLTVAECWEQGLSTIAERMSHNKDYITFTDQEVITIFLNGIQSGKSTIKAIYNYTVNHLSEWFQHIGTYQSFLRRINNLADAFAPLTEMISTKLLHTIEHIDYSKIIDSIPIVMAKQSRSGRAKVAPELASKGYCGSKEMYYYGVKLHIVANRRLNGLPVLEYAGMSEASLHDRAAFEQIAPILVDVDLFADKAYINKNGNAKYLEENNLQVVMPVKLAKGQKRLDSADSLYSAAVSGIRQPIESLFNWINEKTAIQNASKVRSAKGLLTHAFGRLAAGLLMFKEAFA